jgi:uncharacterized membrane protein
MILIHKWTELAAQGVEALAVTVIVSSILIGTFDWLLHSVQKIEGSYERYRIVLGKTLLVGLELLVAADIINTVAFALTPRNLTLLGGLVLVRTALGWTLTVEVEGHWPWQRSKESLIESGRRSGPRSLSRKESRPVEMRRRQFGQFILTRSVRTRELWSKPGQQSASILRPLARRLHRRSKAS